MTARIVLGVLLGAALGAAVGYFGKCRGGTCPLTCKPIGGLIVGAVLGGVLMSQMTPRGKAYTPSPHFIEAAGATEFQNLLDKHGVLLVDFYADWCGPCRGLKPTLHALADRYAGRAAVVGVNVERYKDLAARYGVSGIPDVRVFKQGAVVEQIVGMRPESAYAAALDKQL